MDGSQALLESDPPISGRLFPQQQRRTRGREEGLAGPSERVKKAKLNDLNPLLQQDGITTQISVITKERKIEDFGHQNEEEGTSQLIESTSLGLSDRHENYFPMNHDSLKADSITLTLGLDEKFRSHSENSSDVASENQRGSHQPKDVLETNSNATDLATRAVNLNEPFYQYRILGQVRSTEASECGSTTSSAENNETMRRWNEMKQNGFAYKFQGRAPIPKPWCQITQKNDELKKKAYMTKQEQSSMCTKISSSGQLLCGLNPGIIKHVRNSKQVNSIIKAMLQNEKLEKEEVHRPTGHLRKSKQAINLWKEKGSSSAVDNIYLSLNKPSCSHFGSKEQVDDLDMSKYKFNHENYHKSEFSSKFDDGALTLKKASTVTNTSNASFPRNCVEINYLSFKALKRSKMRVRNVIQVEFPYLLSRDCPPNKENEAPFAHSFLVGCSNKAISDLHMDRWKALFNQMDLSLSEEGKQLEKWLGQVKELKFQCDKGLRYVTATGLLHLDSNLRVLKSREERERELAVRAAAASIYSTCNMIMTSKKVPFFQG